MATFELRGLDAALWARVRARAEADGFGPAVGGGQQLRLMGIKLLEAYAEGRISLSPPAPPSQVEPT